MLIKEDTNKEEEQQSSWHGSEMSTDIQREDWGVVSVEGASFEISDGERSTSSSREHSASGILILSGEESVDVDVATDGTKNLSLSFPGSDSFPSEIGSLRDYTEEPPEPERTTQEQTMMVPRKETNMTRLTEFCRLRKAQVSLAGALVVSLLMTVYFVGQRNSWRSSAFRLEEENHQLKRELEEARNAFLDWQAETPTTTLVDNCWLRAGASLQLGSCAEEARESAIDLTNSLLESLDEFVETMSYGTPEPEEEPEILLEDDILNMNFTVRKIWSKISRLWSTEETKAQERVHRDRSDGRMENITSLFDFFSTGEGQEKPMDFANSPVDTPFGLSEAFSTIGAYSIATGEALLSEFIKSTAQNSDLNRSLTFLLNAIEDASQHVHVEP